MTNTIRASQRRWKEANHRLNTARYLRGSIPGVLTAVGEWKPTFVVIPKRTINEKLVFGRAYMRTVTYVADDSRDIWKERREYADPKTAFIDSLK